MDKSKSCVKYKFNINCIPEEKLKRFGIFLETLKMVKKAQAAFDRGER